MSLKDACDLFDAVYIMISEDTADHYFKNKNGDYCKNNVKYTLGEAVINKTVQIPDSLDVDTEGVTVIAEFVD